MMESHEILRAMNYRPLKTVATRHLEALVALLLQTEIIPFQSS